MTRRKLSPLLARALIVATLAAMAVALSTASAQTISGSGGWSVTIDSSDLQAGAGTNLVTTLTSSTNAGTLSGSNSFFNWHVTVQRTGNVPLFTPWPNGLNLQVRRTGNGTSMLSLTGGTTFMTITTTAQTFFSSPGADNSIPLQYRLTGLSLQIRPSGYKTTVTYTILSG